MVVLFASVDVIASVVLVVVVVAVVVVVFTIINRKAMGLRFFIIAGQFPHIKEFLESAVTCVCALFTLRFVQYTEKRVWCVHSNFLMKNNRDGSVGLK